MSNAEHLTQRARSLHEEGLLSADGLARFEAALQTDEATPSEYLAFLDHIETRRAARGTGDEGTAGKAPVDATGA